MVLYVVSSSLKIVYLCISSPSHVSVFLLQSPLLLFVKCQMQLPFKKFPPWRLAQGKAIIQDLRESQNKNNKEEMMSGNKNVCFLYENGCLAER